MSRFAGRMWDSKMVIAWLSLPALESVAAKARARIISRHSEDTGM